jgi:hypothetical protein
MIEIFIMSIQNILADARIYIVEINPWLMTQSEIDISPFLKTQKPSIAKTSGTYVSSKDKINKYLKSSKIKSYQYIPYS